MIVPVPFEWDFISIIKYLFFWGRALLDSFSFNFGWGEFSLWDFAISAAVFSLVMWAIFRILE